MMINSDPYAERTVCSCLISNPYMSNWNAAQGSCIYFFFFFFLLLLTEALSLPIFSPCARIWRRPMYNAARKSKVASFDLHCWDRLMGEHCKSSLVPNPLTDSFPCRGRWIGFFFYYEEKKSLDKLPMWEGKSTPNIKSAFLPALLPCEKVMHICKLEKSVPCKKVILHNSRYWELKERLLWCLPTQDVSLCCVL